MYNTTTKNVHISTIKAGDTILFDGDIKTVSPNNIKKCEFMGTSLFGDSYHMGYKPVVLVRFIKGTL